MCQSSGSDLQKTESWMGHLSTHLSTESPWKSDGLSFKLKAPEAENQGHLDGCWELQLPSSTVSVWEEICWNEIKHKKPLTDYSVSVFVFVSAAGDRDSKWSVHYSTQKPRQGLRFIPGKRRSGSADDLRGEMNTEVVWPDGVERREKGQREKETKLQTVGWR